MLDSLASQYVGPHGAWHYGENDDAQHGQPDAHAGQYHNPLHCTFPFSRSRAEYGCAVGDGAAGLAPVVVLIPCHTLLQHRDLPIRPPGVNGRADQSSLRTRRSGTGFACLSLIVVNDVDPFLYASDRTFVIFRMGNRSTGAGSGGVPSFKTCGSPLIAQIAACVRLLTRIFRSIALT